VWPHHLPMLGKMKGLIGRKKKEARAVPAASPPQSPPRDLLRMPPSTLPSSSRCRSTSWPPRSRPHWCDATPPPTPAAPLRPFRTSSPPRPIVTTTAAGGDATETKSREDNAAAGTPDSPRSPQSSEDRRLSDGGMLAAADPTLLWAWGRVPGCDGRSPNVLSAEYQHFGALRGKRVVHIACSWQVEKCFYLTDTGDIFSAGDVDGDDNGRGPVTRQGGERRGTAGSSFKGQNQPRLVGALALQRALQGHRIVGIACGVHHTVATTEDGQVFSWGTCCRWGRGVSE